MKIILSIWNGEEPIYLYDISTSKETQLTSTGRASCPSIYGDRVVWEDNRSENKNYMYNISTYKEIQITIEKSEPYQPAIYGNIIGLDPSLDLGKSSLEPF